MIDVRIKLISREHALFERHNVYMYERGRQLHVVAFGGWHGEMAFRPIASRKASDGWRRDEKEKPPIALCVTPKPVDHCCAHRVICAFFKMHVFFFRIFIFRKKESMQFTFLIS